jgi:drug/metabolite transporter (DMT)-like permease
MTRVPWAAYACLGASMFLVGSYVGLSKLLLAAFPVFLLAWLRFGIAALAMLPWLKSQPSDAVLSRREHALLFAQSFLGNFLFSICMLYGVLLSSAVAAGVVMAALPAAVAVLSWLFLRERLAGRVWMAIACAAAGIVLLAVGRAPASAGDAAPEHAAWGHVLLLLATVCEASYVVIGKRLAHRVSARRVSAWINLWGLALITPFGLWQAWRFQFAGVSAPIWSLLTFYSIAASVVTVWLWMRGLRDVPAARAGVFTVMLPVASALVGVLVLGEAFGAWHVVAFVLALAGLVLATWPYGSEPVQAQGVRA